MTKPIERHSLFMDILLTIVTFGLYNLWVQMRQIFDTNDALGENSFSFGKVIILSILTLGLYFCYHEYKMTILLHRAIFGREDKQIAILCGVASFFGLWFVVDTYQQSLLNRLALDDE